MTALDTTVDDVTVDGTSSAGEPTGEGPEPVLRRRTILGPPHLAGTIGALLFLWASFWPTLMPRTFVTQGAISGVCAAAGYALFTFFGIFVRIGVRNAGATISGRTRRIAWIVVGACAAFVVVIGALWMWVRWQNEQRSMLGMDDLNALAGVPMIVVATIVAIVLGLIGRLIGRGVVHLYRLVSRWLSPAVATIVTVLVVWLIASFVFSDVIADGFRRWANTSFGTIDDGTETNVVQPTSPSVSGSPDSLAAWETLGLQGRSFVAGATPIDTITEFQRSIGNDEVEATDPIRVYAGIRSADDLQERADLPGEELERTGGFDRDVLVVATATGTGWIDPNSAESIELMHGGDTAIVSIQYSYLPSWIAWLLVDDASSDAGSVLFDTVYDEWATLPEDDRPKLIVYGLSLGSQGAEAPFASETAYSSVANLAARSDGALFVGPTSDNEIHRKVTAARADDSPVWRPDYEDGQTVRFANTADELVELDPSWAAPRVQYMQHGSDPVTFFTMDTLWSPPEWMDHPRGPDVPRGGPWVPFVTFTQTLFDLMAGFGAPPGHGHDYEPAWSGAWAQVVPPEGWAAADTEALNTFLAEQTSAADDTAGG